MEIEKPFITCRYCSEPRYSLLQLSNKMRDKFNFYFAKPITEILQSCQLKHVIQYRDIEIFGMDTEYMKRLYSIKQSNDRIRFITKFYQGRSQTQFTPQLRNWKLQTLILQRQLQSQQMNLIVCDAEQVLRDPQQPEEILKNIDDTHISFETETHNVYLEDNTQPEQIEFNAIIFQKIHPSMTKGLIPVNHHYELCCQETPSFSDRFQESLININLLAKKKSQILGIAAIENARTNAQPKRGTNQSIQARCQQNLKQFASDFELERFQQKKQRQLPINGHNLHESNILSRLKKIQIMQLMQHYSRFSGQQTQEPTTDRQTTSAALPTQRSLKGNLTSKSISPCILNLFRSQRKQQTQITRKKQSKISLTEGIHSCTRNGNPSIPSGKNNEENEKDPFKSYMIGRGNLSISRGEQSRKSNDKQILEINKKNEKHNKLSQMLKISNPHKIAMVNKQLPKSKTQYLLSQGGGKSIFIDSQCFGIGESNYGYWTSRKHLSTNSQEPKFLQTKINSQPYLSVTNKFSTNAQKCKQGEKCEHKKNGSQDIGVQSWFNQKTRKSKRA